MPDVRLLSRSSVPPYTVHRSRAMANEPEAVDHDAQESMTLAVARAQRARRRAAWEVARHDLQRARELLLAQQLTRSSDVRVLERFIARLDRTMD